MGLEADCTLSWGEETSKGRARLETDTVSFKGTFRLVIPRRDIKKVVAREGRLEIAFGRDRAVLDLGAQAERWADKIQNPPSVLDKLGVKAGLKVSVVGTPDEALVALLHERTGTFAVGRARAASDIVFLFATAPRDLARLAVVRASIVPSGAIWVVWPKGRPELKEDHVRAAARPLELVDVKVASLSERLSGLKLVIPRAKR